MSRIVIPHVVARKPRHMYYLDSEGSLWEAPMGKGRGAKKLLIRHVIDRRPRIMYFLDGKGNLCESPMKRRR
jgi:hypothetical protein